MAAIDVLMCHLALIASLYVSCCGDVVRAAGCVDSWCAPPLFPDLLTAFAQSLSRSPTMRNLTTEVLAATSPPSAPCRRLLDCCLPIAAADAPQRRPWSCSVDDLPPLPSCHAGGSLDPIASGRPPPGQFSRSLEDGVSFSTDWFESVLSSADAVLDVPPQGHHDEVPAWSGDDETKGRASGPTERDPAESAGSRIAVAAATTDVDSPPPASPRLWATVRGRLLIVAVVVSMLASAIFLGIWIGLRKRLSKYEAAPETEQEAICMYERVLADRTKSHDRRQLRRPVATGNDVISDERTLIGPGDCRPTPSRRYV